MEPGWLKRDMDKATSRLEEWRGKSNTPAGQDGLVEELCAALEGLVECLEDGVFDEAYADMMREKGRAALARARETRHE